jgi:CheY-like chemotaxis protein
MSRVLVVDNDEATAAAIAEVFPKTHELRTATDGDEAMADALGFVPDLVLLDLDTPGVAAIETARRLRTLFGHGMRIVALTKIPRRSTAQILALGFDGLLLKPISSETLAGAAGGAQVNS